MYILNLDKHESTYPIEKIRAFLSSKDNTQSCVTGNILIFRKLHQYLSNTESKELYY